MKDILAELEASIGDEHFSRAEKKSVRSLVAEYQPNTHDLAVLRSKVFDMANERINAENFAFIMQWVEEASKALVVTSADVGDEVYFSPGKACRATILNQIGLATQSLDICVFTISDDFIADALIQAQKRKLKIRLITDNDKTKDKGSDIDRIHQEGLAVKIDDTRHHMHHKFMVADEKIALTGSYNWTRSAAKFNHENLLLTRDPSVVRAFLKEFEDLWKEMVDYS
ncbi:MAG: phospholipase D-like domain-containing protein [Cytophagales bacterium]|nr:phospholipase D-like domain-containing protein [Cytophagales bacterium]